MSTHPSRPAATAASVPAITLSRIRSRLRLRHLVFIESLARHGNIRQAARDLFITQPAASKLLHEIETTFDVKLYERTAHGIASTPHGAVLLHWARKALAEMDAAEAELAALSQGWEGRVRVGVFPVAAPVLVPDAIARLRTTRPLIRISLIEGLEDRLVPLLGQGLVDCVIGRMTVPAESGSVATEVLFEEPTVVVCRLDHPLLQDTDWRPAALNRHDWILPSTIAPLYSLVAAGLAARRAGPPRVSVETSSILTLVEIVRQTEMLSAIPHGVASRFVAAGQLAILPLELACSLYPVAIMTMRDSTPNPATAAFLDAIRAAAIGAGIGRTE